MPKSLFSTGSVRDGVVRFVNTNFVFDDPAVAVTAAAGVIEQQGRSFTHAYEIYLEQATLLFDFAVIDGKPVTSTPLTVLGRNGKVTQPQLPAVDGFVAELTDAAKSVKSGELSPLLAGNLACDALHLCHKQIESVKAGRIVKV
jgi:hypothetical protein